MCSRFAQISVLISGLIFVCAINCSQSTRYTRSGYPVHYSSDTDKRSTSERIRYNGHKVKGIASYYGRKFHGRKTANGEIFNMHAMTAAHKTLPFNTVVKVVNIENGNSVIVRINDRGPYVRRRIIDLSYGAAQKMGMLKEGKIKVKLIILEKAVK